MRFLQRPYSPHLENLCARWHLRPRMKRAVYAARRNRALEHPMLDILMLALAVGLFAAGIGYAYVCERL